MIFNPDNLHATDGGTPPDARSVGGGDAAADAPRPDARPDAAAPDARPDAAAPDAGPDADLGALSLDHTDPAALDEGVGGAGRKVPVVIYGANIAGAATVAASGVTGATISKAVVSGNHDMLAVGVHVPVITGCGKGSTETLSLTVSQGGTSRSIDVPVNCLDELNGLQGTVSTDNITIEPLYSQITFASDVQLTGSKPARFVATAAISVSAHVSVDGSTGGAPGAGGCEGGGSKQDGLCGMGGGGRGTSSSSGGGGGGFGSAGAPGTGAGAGSGGAVTGDAMLPVLTFSTNQAGSRGNGGGGGYDGGVGGKGGPGGGGGGVLELTSGGTLTIAGSGSITARGGDGTPGSGLVATAGGGGGGSGGAILLRASGAITAGSNQVSAPGGNGASGNNGGGGGGDGRIRVDTPKSGALGFVGQPLAARGGMWTAASVPAIVSSPTIQAVLVGDPGRSYVPFVGVQGNDTLGTAVTVQGTGTVSVDLSSDGLTLQPGLNQVCVLVKPGASQFNSEAVNCRSVAYIPQ